MLTVNRIDRGEDTKSSESLGSIKTKHRRLWKSPLLDVKVQDISSSETLLGACLHKQLTVYRVMAPKVTKKYPLIGPSSDCEVFIPRAASPHVSSTVYNYLDKNFENGIDGEEEEVVI